MGTTLTPDNIPAPRPNIPPGHDVKSLGPSDSSDSGSDLAGQDVGDDETESEIAGGEEQAGGFRRGAGSRRRGQRGRARRWPRPGRGSAARDY
jgi:hypothetical protein